MKRKQLSVNNQVEALVVEQALLLVRELQRTCRRAPRGQVLDQAEGVVVTKGRDLLRLALQASLQQQAEEVEKKGRLPVGAVVNGSDVPKVGVNEPC